MCYLLLAGILTDLTIAYLISGHTHREKNVANPLKTKQNGNDVHQLQGSGYF